MRPFPLKLSRMEISGSLGDVGTLLPLAVGMILVNGLSAPGLFMAVGLFYIFAGLYYRLPTPVQPMKVIGAYAIATAATPGQIHAAGLLMAGFLFLVGSTGIIEVIRRLTPRAAIRGVQLSAGIMLMVQGLKFMLGTTSFQSAAGLSEPHLSIQSIGPVPIGIILGLVFGLATLLLLDNRRFPAGLVVVLGGLGVGLVLGQGIRWGAFVPGLHIPRLLPTGLPSLADFMWALPVLALPQLPMTLGNAVVANTDLAREYFGPEARRVTGRALCLSMSGANLLSAVFGGMPLCHGAGGLAAHYRFGARDMTSNIFIGLVFAGGALLLGPGVVDAAHLLPLSVLGVLLAFAGSALAMTVMDVSERKDIFVVVLMLGVSLAANLAWAFGLGVVAAYVLKSPRLSV